MWLHRWRTGGILEIRATSLLFPEASGQGPLTAEAEVRFPRAVLRTAAGITGYTAVFENDDDHHVGRLEVEVDARVDTDDPAKVLVSGRFGLRDWSNEFDDPYSGLIDVAVLADLVPVTPPGPGGVRGDLVIVGAEITQAIQHFRSADHLDAPNVFPDNSIRLVAGKPTVVRLYVDYDAGSGLPPISTLSGQLVLFNPAGSLTLSPIEPMQPRRDVSIDRGNRRHTLNFLVPDAQSIGELNLLATVFDAFDATQKSGPFERTINFVQQPSLRVLAVGINYTGDDVVDGAPPEDLQAPTQTDFVDTLELTDRLYPIPSVVLTDYRTMDYDEDVTSDISEGCDKLQDLKDAVADFVGDSDDVVYGLFGPGVDTGSVGGCGGGGVGVGRVFSGGTAAHEIGHALGRKHAPCDNVTRCATPRNTDDDYPVYSGYDSDSIGEYGFDPTSTSGTVRNPSTSHDFMGYSPNDWISPYTYKALMSAIPGSPVGGGAAEAGLRLRKRRPDGEWIPIKQPKLFLRLDIDRDEVRLHPSFHYDALPRRTSGEPTRYRIELHGDDGRVLRSACLYAEHHGCGCNGPDRPPVRVRQAIPYAPRAGRMVLYDRDDELRSWELPEAPAVDVECQPDEDPNYLRLRWRVSPGATKASKRTYWSLVQWRDRLGTWRGVAPRLEGYDLRVPRRIAGMGNDVRYRVLVTSGIATGVGYWSGDCGEVPLDRPEPPRVTLVGTGGARTSQDLPRLATAAVIGAGELGGKLRWFGPGGGEIARGPRLDLSRLDPGFNVVTAQVTGTERSVPAAQWLIERTSDDRFVLHVGQVGGRDTRDDEEPDRDHQHDHDQRHHHHSHTHDEGR
jgi:hypothetical protein